VIIFLKGINRLFFIMETHCVYCEVKKWIFVHYLGDVSDTCERMHDARSELFLLNNKLTFWERTCDFRHLHSFIHSVMEATGTYDTSVNTDRTARHRNPDNSARNNSAPNGRIFTIFDIWTFFRKSVAEIQGTLQRNKNYGHFTEDLRVDHLKKTH
jgi:hypothetical protein